MYKLQALHFHVVVSNETDTACFLKLSCYQLQDPILNGASSTSFNNHHVHIFDNRELKITVIRWPPSTIDPKLQNNG
jgi:hypothetical protein